MHANGRREHRMFYWLWWALIGQCILAGSCPLWRQRVTMNHWHACCVAGADLQQFAIVVDPSAVPPSLKSIILHFVLVACSFLDEARVKQLQQTQSGQPSGLRSSTSASGQFPAADGQTASLPQAVQPQDAQPGPRQQHSAASKPAPEPLSSAEWLPYPMDSSRAGSSAGKASRQSRRQGHDIMQRLPNRLPPAQGDQQSGGSAMALTDSASVPGRHQRCAVFTSADVHASRLQAHVVFRTTGNGKH